MDESQRYYLGRVEKNTIVLKQNSEKFREFDISLDTAIASSLDSFKCGITKYATTVSDAPEEGNGFLISIYRNQNNICQIAIPENSGKIYSRISKNPDGLFSNWK